MPDIIQLSEALRKMERVDHKGNPTIFSVTVVTADVLKKTGGEIRTYTNCILAKYAKHVPRALRGAPTGDAKNPDHWKNSTRNILLLDTNEIRKIHIRLIIAFDNQTVIY